MKKIILETLNYIIEKIYIERDKANHFVWGILIFFCVSIFFGSIIGCFITVLAAFLKEIYDSIKTKIKFPDWSDIFWTGFGCLIGLLLKYF